MQERIYEPTIVLKHYTAGTKYVTLHTVLGSLLREEC